MLIGMRQIVDPVGAVAADHRLLLALRVTDLRGRVQIRCHPIHSHFLDLPQQQIATMAEHPAYDT
jgi:hypothetical protein